MKTIGTGFAAALWVWSAIAGAQGIDAKALHDAQCMSCHGTEVYTRQDRRVQSLEALRNQIQRCTMATRAGWSDAEKAAVVDYLNREFYRFGQ